MNYVAPIFGIVNLGLSPTTQPRLKITDTLYLMNTNQLVPLGQFFSN